MACSSGRSVGLAFKTNCCAPSLGTLWKGNELIEGVLEVLALLRALVRHNEPASTSSSSSCSRKSLCSSSTLVACADGNVGSQLCNSTCHLDSKADRVRARPCSCVIQGLCDIYLPEAGPWPSDNSCALCSADSTHTQQAAVHGADVHTGLSVCAALLQPILSGSSGLNLCTCILRGFSHGTLGYEGTCPGCSSAGCSRLAAAVLAAAV